MRTTYCGLVSEALLGQTVTLMGWAHRRRDHGGVIFIDLRDREGMVQVVCDPDRPEMFRTAEGVRNEYCLKIVGKVRPRPAGTENANLTSGKVEVLCHELEVLNPSVTPPFQLDDDNLSETVRLTHRVLDLRRPAMQKNLRLRYRIAAGSIHWGYQLYRWEYWLRNQVQTDLLRAAEKTGLPAFEGEPEFSAR